MTELSKEAKAQRAEYQREYRRRNPDKQKEYVRRYWEKKALEAKTMADTNPED